jgi:ATP-binding cassette subfamily B protein
VWWCSTRGASLRSVEAQVKAFQSGTDTLRRAYYFQQLATRPAAAKETRVFGLGEWVVDQFRVHRKVGIAESWGRRLRTDRLVLVTGIGGAAVSILVAGVLGYDVLHGRATLTDIGIVLPSIASAHIIGGLGLFDWPVTWATGSLPVFEAVERRLHATASASGAGGGLDPGAMPRSDVRFEGVSFRYPGSSVNTMDGLDLTLTAGRSTAIVGANGAGKTTLIKLLSGLHPPTGGRITVDGCDLAELRQAEWQRRVAVVFQDFTRYPCSFADNIGFGAIEHLGDRSGITAAADRAGAADIAEQLPAGWDTVLSRQFTGGADLSGGQWQRLALARAMYAIANGATMLVLDEPTAWLDVRGEAAFYDRFLELTRGLTTVIISHRFSTVRQADSICVIDGGRVVEQGDHASLLQQSGTYARMFTLQATRFSDGGGDSDSTSDSDPIGEPA